MLPLALSVWMRKIGRTGLSISVDISAKKLLPVTSQVVRENLRGFWGIAALEFRRTQLIVSTCKSVKGSTPDNAPRRRTRRDVRTVPLSGRPAAQPTALLQEHWDGSPAHSTEGGEYSVTYLAVSERPCRFAENRTLAFDQSGARVVEKCDLIRPDRPLRPIFTSRKLGSDADMPPRDGIAGVRAMRHG
jgi:hypothetical protein